MPLGLDDSWQHYLEDFLSQMKLELLGKGVCVFAHQIPKTEKLSASKPELLVLPKFLG